MGTSNWQNISYCIGIIKKINPQKILDIGIGFGKWGFLAREYLDIWNERVNSKDWLIEIDGVEIFEKNIDEHQKKVYSNIYIGDALEYIKKTTLNYELIIIGDVLEHFNKKDGYSFLENCYNKSEYLLLNIPIGKYWEQSTLYENEFEEHKSFWKLSDFKKFNVVQKKRFRDSQLRLFAVIVMSKKNKKIKSVPHLYKNIRSLLYQYPNFFHFLRQIKNITKSKI